MLKLHHRPSALGGARAGVAAIEFALVAPVLFTMTAGVFDAAKAIILWQQVIETAHETAISATTVSVPANGSRLTSISASAAQQAMSIIYASMPWIRDGIERGQRSVTLTSVAFVPISQSCTVSPTQNCFTAEVAFSVSYKGGSGETVPFTQVTRPCGTPIHQIGATDQIKLPDTQYTVLRTNGISAPDALMIVDVHYQYSPFPIFRRFGFLPPALDFYWTDIESARTGTANTSGGLQYTTYTGTDGTGNCAVG